MAEVYDLELTGCRIKIQVCIGRFPDGRMRTRTFGIKDVRPDVTADDAAAVVRAAAALLAFPVVRARLVRKYVLRKTAKKAQKAQKTQKTPKLSRTPRVSPNFARTAGQKITARPRQKNARRRERDARFFLARCDKINPKCEPVFLEVSV